MNVTVAEVAEVLGGQRVLGRRVRHGRDLDAVIRSGALHDDAGVVAGSAPARYVVHAAETYLLAVLENLVES